MIVSCSAIRRRGRAVAAPRVRSTGWRALELVSVEQLVYSRSIVHRLDDRGDRGRSASPTVAFCARNRYDGSSSIACATCRRSTSRARTKQIAPTRRRSSTRSCSRGSTASRVGHQSGAAVRARRRHLRSGDRHALRSHGGPADRRLARRQRAARQRNRTTHRRATHAAIVFDGQHLRRRRAASVPGRLSRASQRLLGVPLLQLVFEASPARWRFVAATGVADFRVGGEPLVRAAHAHAREAAA